MDSRSRCEQVMYTPPDWLIITDERRLACGLPVYDANSEALRKETQVSDRWELEVRDDD